MEWTKQETALVALALVLAAALILFNCLQSPPLASPAMLSVDESSQTQVSDVAPGSETEKTNSTSSATVSFAPDISYVSSATSVVSTVTSITAVSSAAEVSSAATIQKGSINLNTATAEELEAIPGIGPTLSARIIDYRNQYGFFTSFEELGEVEGIGDKKLATIKEWVTLGR